MDSPYNLPTGEFSLKVLPIGHPFVKTITYDPKRESYTFTVEDKLGSKLPNGGKIEFWAVGDQTLNEALDLVYMGQVVKYFERQGDTEMTNYALLLFNS